MGLSRISSKARSSAGSIAGKNGRVSSSYRSLAGSFSSKRHWLIRSLSHHLERPGCGEMGEPLSVRRSVSRPRRFRLAVRRVGYIRLFSDLLTTLAVVSILLWVNHREESNAESHSFARASRCSQNYAQLTSR